MRLSKPMAALALSCAGVGAGGAALGQNAPQPREVHVTERRDVRDQADRPAESPRPPESPVEQRVVELYRAQLGGQLTKASYLGVSTSGVPAALRQHLGLPEGVGLVVDFVEDESPAKSAGLKQYDILTRFDDQILVNGQQLAVLVRSRKAGEDVKLTLVRGGKEQSVTAKLVEKDVKPLGDMFIFDQPDALGADGVRWVRPMVRLGQPTRPQPPRNSNRTGSRDVSVWRDNDMTLTIRKDDKSDGRRLTVTDKSGKTVFEGNLDKPEDRGRMPPHIAEKVRQMEAKRAPGAADRKDGDDARGTIEFDAGGEDNVEFDLSLDGSLEFRVESEDAPGGDDDDGRRAQGERSPSARRRIGNEDLLNIAISDVHGPGVRTTKLSRVRDGRVHLPYVAPVECVGLTERELEKQIVSLYAEAKVAPKVEVRVRTVQPAGVKRAPEGVPSRP